MFETVKCIKTRRKKRERALAVKGKVWPVQRPLATGYTDVSKAKMHEFFLLRGQMKEGIRMNAFSSTPPPPRANSNVYAVSVPKLSVWWIRIQDLVPF